MNFPEFTFFSSLFYRNYIFTGFEVEITWIQFNSMFILISPSFNLFAGVPLSVVRHSDRNENSPGKKIFDKDVLEEDLESTSEIGSDEESEDGITGIDRTSADEDNSDENEEDEDENDDSEDDDESEEDEDENGDSEDDDESDSGPDLARGKGNIETSSEDEEDMEDLLPEESGFEHAWRELDKDAPRSDEVKF